MKLTRTVTVLGLAVCAAGVALFQGCSSDDSNGGGGNPEGGTGDLLHPPGPGGSATTSTEERNFAIQKLFLGHTNRDGTQNLDAWQTFGYDLDGKATTATSTDVCTPLGADTGKQVDGPHGVDNSFGYNVMPLLTYVASTAQDDINTAIGNGAFTAMIDVKGLTDDATQTATGLSAKFFGGSTLSSKPTFTTADKWPVTYESLVNGDVNDPKIQFPNGYITSGTWVNAQSGAGSITIALVLQSSTVNLTIRNAIITFEHSAPGDAANGIIAGVVKTQDFLDALDPAVAAVGACSTFATIGVPGIREASDMLSDGTNVAGQPCDAISIGVGFTAKQIGAPAGPADPVPPGNPPTCKNQDGGANASADGM
ncbi:MAG TPA: hypothetical protein VNO21_05560 [Polyangiaceae bacterium]|nr:hypothetical protein [Polyangiaceae bacterium]